MAMCLPWSGRSCQRPDLISRARSSKRRRSPGSRSATSMKSRPLNEITRRIMISQTLLEAGFDQLPGHDRRDRQVADRIELGQPHAEPGLVAEADDQVAAGGRGKP